jgi:hypothetical protein
MSIRAFSAQRFYALATGSPIDRSEAVITLDSDIPERGIRLVTPDPEGEAELVWIHGVAALGEQRERFIEEIREGRIPTPLSISNGSATNTHVRYYALESLHTREQTIASLLGLTEPIVAAAKRSRWARCPSCAQPLPLFRTASELNEHLLRVGRGRDCTIELMGNTEDLSPWATAHGFVLASTHEGRSSIRVDSLTCSPEALQKVEPILASTQHITNTWITVSGANEREEYGWNGRCARCDVTLTPFNPAAARDYIERPLSSRLVHEGNRIVDDVTLSELLGLPLGRVLQGALAQEQINPLQLEILRSLSLEDLTLQSRTTELSPLSLTSLTLMALAHDAEKPSELRIFKAPACLFSSSTLSSVMELTQKLSTNSGFVWITPEPKESVPLQITKPQERTTRRIGSVTLNAPIPINLEIDLGQWNEVHVPPPWRHLRIGSIIHQSVSGEANPLVSCHLALPCSPYFVPLFGVESSATRLVAHALGVLEPLAKMFAASHHAKMLGLNARDFALGQIRQSTTVCTSCKGAGILITKHHLFPNVEPCHACWGARFRSPTREVTFKGKTLWEILNAPLSSLRDTLRALPKMKEVFELSSLLTLTDLPLGMPVTLLATPQRRLLTIAHAMLAGTTTRPAIVVIEEPSVGWSVEQRQGVESAIAHPTFIDRVAWIGVNGQ